MSIWFSYQDFSGVEAFAQSPRSPAQLAKHSILFHPLQGVVPVGQEP